jgi:hypothetical protein
MHMYKRYSDKDRDEVRQQLKMVAEKIIIKKIDTITGLRRLSCLWRFADYREQHQIRAFLTDFNFTTARFPKRSSCQHYRKDYLADLQKQEQRFVQENWPQILKMSTKITHLSK